MSYKDYLSDYGKKQYNKRTGATAETKNTGGAKTAPPPVKDNAETVTAPPAKVVITPPVVTPSPINSPNAQYWNGPVTNNMPVAPVVAPPPVKDNTETVTVAPLPERSYNQFETEVSKPSPSHTAPENNPFQNEYKEYVEAVTEPKPEPSDDKVIAPPLPERGYDQFETFKNGGATAPEPKAPPAVKESPIDSPTKGYWSEPITEQLPPPTEPKQPEIDLEEIYFAVKYEGLGYDELVGRYNELYGEYATTGNVGLIPELNFLSKRAEEAQSPEVLDWKRGKAIDNAKNAYDEYEEYMFAHNSLYGPDDNSTSSTRKGEAKYNAYKNFNAEASRYEYLYRNALKNEIAEEYEVPAMESPSFEVHSKFDKNQLGGDYKDVNKKPDYTGYTPSTNVNSFVTDEERGVYNFWAKINPTKADEYLEALEPLLKKRMTEFNNTVASNYAKDHPVAASIDAFTTKLNTLPKTAAYTFASNLAGKYDPDSRILQNRIYANALQSNVSQNINNPIGSFIYDNGISIAESATYAALFGPYAVYFLGTSAAVDKARDTALNGGNDAQILLSGIAAGAAEVIFEKIGFDNLFKAKSVGNIADVLQTTLKQSGIEMGEEFCTSLASIASDNFIMGGKSEYNRLVEKYVDNGYSRSEARSKAIVDMGGEVFIESLAGAFSGSVFGAVDAGARYVNASGIGNEAKNNGSISEIVNAGKNQPETSSAFERAGKIENSKNPSNAEVGALVQQMVIDGQITQEEAQELVSGDKAMPENAQAYYYAGANGLSFSDAVDSNPNIVINPDTAYDAWKAGKDLSENKKVETTPEEKTVAETTPEEITPEEITPEVKEVPEVKTEPEVIPSSEEVAPEKTTSEEIPSEVKAIPETEVTPETKAEVVTDVKTKEETPEAKVEVVTKTKTTQSPVVETAESKPTAVETKTAPTAKAETEGRGNEYVKAAAEHRTEENKESFDVAYDLGLTGRDITELPLPGISADDAVKAWVAGKTDRANLRATSTEGMPTKTVSPVKETVSTKEVAPTKEVTPTKEAEVVKTTNIKGGNVVETPAIKNAPKTVKFQGKAYEQAKAYRTEANAKDFEYAYSQGFNRVKPSEDINLEDVAISSAYLAGVSDSRAVVSSRANFEARTPGLNLVNTVSRDIAGTLSDSTRVTINNIGKKLGVEIRLTNRTNEIAQGNIKHSRNSSYNFKNGVVTINVDEIHIGLKGRKLKKNELVRFILAHEGTHRLQETSPEAYAEMEKIALSKSNMTLEEYMEKWNISDEAEARGEIVADYFGDLLSSKAEVKALLNENRSLWDKILEVIDWLIYKLKGAGIAYNDIAEARELFRQALNEADATAWGREVREDESGSFGENEVVLSRSTYDKEGRTKLIKWLNNSKLEKSERDRIVSQLDFIYDITTKYTDKYTVFGNWSDAEVEVGEDGKPVLSVVKKNGEYALNLDFSSVCSKRRPLDTIITKMVKDGVIKDVMLDGEGAVELNKIIKKHGLTIACSLCYVEGRRYRQENVAKTFADMYNELVDRYKENPTNFSKRILAEQPLNDKGQHKETVPFAIAKHLETHPNEREHIDYSMFMSSEGFTKVKKERPDLLTLYNKKKGAGGPKAAFSDVQYLNEIISSKSFNPKKAFSVGGVRIQSFSDFVPRLVFDYAQMVADMDAKRLPAHAYTKVPDFVEIFGLTGIKINMSLIPKYVENGVAPGLDSNGNYAWADESFDYDTAIEIQDRDGYTRNCGTIAVGVSRKHILKLLRDENIRMVIPYHKSGINPIIAQMLYLDEYTNYEGSQNTKHKNGKALTDEEKKSHFNFNEAMHIKGMTAKEAADAYLKWCDDNNYAPKFEEFRGEENYYKLLEDFTCYDKDGNFCPQEAVKMNYPENLDELIDKSIKSDQKVEDDIGNEAQGVIDEFAEWSKTRGDGEVWSRGEKNGSGIIQSRSEPEKTFAKGEAPRRDIDVPSEVGGKKVMRGARTTAEAEGINEDYAFNLVEEIRNGNFTYEVSSNKAVALKATNEVNENYDEAKAKWDGIIMSGKRVTPEDIALGEALLVEASHRRSVEETLKINAEVAMLATEAGQVVQAMRILKRLSPDGQLRYLEVVTDRINAERQKTKGKKYNRLIESENEVNKVEKKYQEADKKVKKLEKESEEILNTINQLQSELESEDRIANLEEQEKALKKEIAMLKKELAKESDASGKEKIREQIRILEEDIKENASQLKDALDEKSRLVSERNAMGKELTAIKNAKKATDNAVEKLAGDMALLENEIADLDSQLEKATKFKKELKEELSKLRKERRTIKDKIKRREDSSEKAFAEIEPLENEIAELKEKLEVANTALNEVTEKRNALREERNKLRGKLERREGAIERETTRTKEITNQIAQLLDDLYNADIALEQAKANRKAVNEKRQKVNELARYAQSKAGKVVLPDDLKAKILQAQNEDELKAAMEIATDYIAENVKTTWAEKIRAWRYLAMLGNLRTIFRNFVGNIFMNIPVAAKNVFAYPLELVGVSLNNAIVNANAKRMAKKGISQETIDSYLDRSIAYKTQTLKVFKKRSEDMKSFVNESWDANIKVAMEGGKYDSTSMADEIESKRVIFDNKVIEAWRKATNRAMESGDLVFVRFNYKQALTRFMLANNLNPETITQAERAKAEAYAIKEAQEATFRDKSKLAESLNTIKKTNWATELLFGGLFPFTKTPINVMKRSFEYSPLGIFNMASDIVGAIKGTKNVTDVINSAAKMVSGSALVVIGAVLAAQGLLRSTGDDEDEEYDYLVREQDYAFIIDEEGRYTIDWLSPTAIPLLLGASIFESYFKNDSGVKKKYYIDENGNPQEATAYMNFVDTLNKAMNLFNPVFEATYLSGFSDAIETGSQFASMPGESLIAFGTSSVLSFAKQFIPTALGQVARIIDPIERRNNEVDPTSGIPRYAQKGVAKIKNSIPFLRQTSTPYVDAWGRIPDVKDEASDYFWSAVENLISPGFYQEVKEDDITKELYRLQNTEDGKDKDIFPDVVSNSYSETVDGEKHTYYFNPEQKNKRQIAEAEASREFAEIFLNSEIYKDLTDEERGTVVQMLNDYAEVEGVKAVYKGFETKNSTVQKMHAAEAGGLKPEKYALYQIALDKVDTPNKNGKMGTYTQDEADAALELLNEMNGGSITDEALALLWQIQTDGVSKNNPYGYAIRGTNWYRPNGKDQYNKLWLKPKYNKE